MSSMVLGGLGALAIIFLGYGIRQRYSLRRRKRGLSPAASLALLDSLPQPLVGLDSQGRVQYCNQALVDLLGRSKTAILTQSLDSWLLGNLPEGLSADSGRLPEVGIRLSDSMHQSMQINPIGDIGEGDARLRLWQLTEEPDMGLSLKALKQSEARFRSLAEQSAQGILVSQAGKLLYANPALAAMLGYESTAEVLAVESIMVFAAPEEQERIVAYTAARMRGEPVPDVYVFRGLRKDGSSGWVENRSSVIDWEGEPAILTSVLDITDRVEAQRKLLAVQERYREMVEGTEDLITRVDHQGNFLYLNHKSRDIFGMEPDECLGRSAFEFIHLEDRARTKEWFQQQVAEKVSNARLENRQVGRDGRVTWVSWNCHFHYRQGDLLAINSIARDISQRRVAEEGLQATLDAIPLGVHLYRIEAGERLVFCGHNRAAEQILGVEHQSFHGRTIEEAFPPLAETEIPAQYRRVVHEGGVWQVDQFAYCGEQIVGTYEVTAFRYRPGQMAVMFADITQRWQAERDLKASEERFRTAFETSPDAILLIDADSRLLEVNRGFCRQTGYAREDVVGRTTIELDLWEKPDLRDQLWKELKEFRRVENFEARFRAKEGGSKTGLLSGQLIDYSGQTCLLAVVRDVTNLKLVEQELRSTYRQLQDIVEFLPDATFVVDRNRRLLAWNKACEALTGVAASELIGKELTAGAVAGHGKERPLLIDLLDDPDSAEQFGYQNVQAEPGRLSAENYNPSLYGGKGAYVWAVAAKLLDQNGEPVGAIETVRDISRWKKSEAALQQSESRYRGLSQEFQAILNGVQDPLLLVDTELKVGWANHAAKRDLPDALVDPAGKTCGQLWHDHRGVCPDCPTRRALTSGQSCFEEVEGKDGRIWEIRVFPVKDEAGQVVSAVQIAQDVTERIQLRQETVRAGQLAAIGELAASVAHEINNPLTGVINFAQILCNRLEQPEQKSMAERIITEGDRVANIVAGLLSFSRVGPSNPVPALIKEVLDDALVLAGIQLQKDGISMQVDLPSDLPLVKVVPQQIQQVFLNLLSNARHALNVRFVDPDPGKLIEIRARVWEEDALRLLVEVHDHGKGIPAELVEKVVNPFFTTKPTTEGTGLGLSVSRNIVADHGGRLQVASEEGSWTRIAFDLPLATSVEG